AGRGLTSFCQRLLEHHHFRDTTLRTPSAAGETAIHAAAKHGWASTLLALLNHPRSKRLAAARRRPQIGVLRVALPFTAPPKKGRRARQLGCGMVWVAT
ncbi:unnamed protein product, partial [Effrenium voratum]